MGNITRAGLALLCLAGALWAARVAWALDLDPRLSAVAAALGFGVTALGLVVDIAESRGQANSSSPSAGGMVDVHTERPSR